MKRAPAITLALRQKIGRYKDRYPKATLSEMAALFNVTVNQVRSSIEGFRSGKYSRTKPRRKSVDISTLLGQPPDKILESQYAFALAQLGSDDKLPADERIASLDKLARIYKTIQDSKIAKHIKSGDSAIVADIVRRYEPGATDERVITVIKEEYERWKNSRQ
jgi:hypothetical protein